MPKLSLDQLQCAAEQLLDLCHTAGEAIMVVYGRDFAVESKADDSPVTAADLAAHRILVDGLARILPGLPILSEESALPDFSERSQWSRYWLVDPLDGTREFVNRNGEFTVNVALVEDGVPVVGVVHAPTLKLSYSGIRGAGARKYEGLPMRRAQSRPIAVRSIASRLSGGGPVELVASRRHGAGQVEQLLGRLEQKLGPVTTRSMGSSLKLCLVAEGEADLYPRLAPTSEWDTAAAQAVVEAAGGLVVDRHFVPLRYNRKADILNPDFYVIGDPAFAWRELLPD